MTDVPESDSNSPIDSRGVYLRSYMMRGGPYPWDLPKQELPKRSEYERGSAQDRAGNRGR